MEADSPNIVAAYNVRNPWSYPRDKQSADKGKIGLFWVDG